jgi:hypothetical protein
VLLVPLVPLALLASAQRLSGQEPWARREQSQQELQAPPVPLAWPP